MLLQPVALAISRWSPNSWVSNFRYGVSPQPAQAPLNSKSGWRSWLVLTEAGSHRAGSVSWTRRNASQATRSTSRCSSIGRRLMLLRLTSLLSWAGQAVTHRPQPVQSSGATCTVSDMPGTSRLRNDFVFSTSASAAANAPGSYTFMRMAACGQTIAHLPQSMHRSASQIGISVATVRFSTHAVPVGNVPSGGMALTGSRSPSPASMRAVTRCTNSVTSPVTVGRRCFVAVTVAVIGTGNNCASVVSTAAMLRCTTTSPRLP